jgi:hypothetical protein
MYGCYARCQNNRNPADHPDYLPLIVPEQVEWVPVVAAGPVAAAVVHPEA